MSASSGETVAALAPAAAVLPPAGVVVLLLLPPEQAHATTAAPMTDARRNCAIRDIKGTILQRAACGNRINNNVKQAWAENAAATLSCPDRVVRSGDLARCRCAGCGRHGDLAAGASGRRPRAASTIRLRAAGRPAA